MAVATDLPDSEAAVEFVPALVVPLDVGSPEKGECVVVLVRIFGLQEQKELQLVEEGGWKQYWVTLAAELVVFAKWIAVAEAVVAVAAAAEAGEV